MSPVSSRLEYDNRLQASIDRLRAMGLKFLVQTPTDKEVYLVIEMDSIINLIEKRISYPTKEIQKMKGGEKDYMVVHFWKGDKPEFLLK